MRVLQLVCAGALISATISTAPGAVVYLQDVNNEPGFTFSGTPVTQATFDDTYVQTGGSASTLNANFGSTGSYQIRTTSSGLVNWALLAVKDMFSQVPSTSGGDAIQINSATLYLASSGSNQPAGYTLNVRRVTTDWLANAPGDNENRASGNQRNAVTPGSALTDGVAWAGGGSFGGADYSATNAVLNAPFANTVYGAYIGIAVTGIVQDMYASGTNYGFVISTPFQQDNFVNIRSSEDTLLPATLETFRPVLAIDYEYVAVPEPSCGVLLVTFGALLIRRRRRC